jgi:mono/diheme cytochrome c family protein
MRARSVIVSGVCLLVAGAVVWQWRAAAAARESAALAAEERKAEDRDALIKRGDYLANEVARCGDCHTPRDDRSRLDMTRAMQGAPIWIHPARRVGKWEDKAPDITPSGKAGKWSEDKMITFLSTGKKSDPPMPAYNLTKEDARALTAYLRSLPGKGKAERRKDDD